MSTTDEVQVQSSDSLLMPNKDYECQSEAEIISTITSKSNDQENIKIPYTVIIILSVNGSCRKKLSVDISLLSYSFLVRLIYRLFNLPSKFIIKTKTNLTIADDFDLDGCIINDKNKTVFEFTIERTEETNDDLIHEDDVNDNFQIINIDNDCCMITMKSISCRQETFLQKATSWFYGTVNMSSNKCLTKKEFKNMLDPSNGRLLNEALLRQRVYESGCEPSIRNIVWCYLFRIYNHMMTFEDKVQYTKKAKERYNEMKQSWKNKEYVEIKVLENLIQKDVTRTDNSLKFFDGQRNGLKQKLLNILMTYCIYHPIPGYVQGMTDMITPILYVMRDEALAYACFCALMRYMSPLFHSDAVAINRRLSLLRKTIQAIDTELWTRIENCDIGKIMFAYRWLLLDCKREFPLKDIFRVFETVWASLPIDRFELNSDSFSDIDDFTPITERHLSTITTVSSSFTNTILSSRSCSPESEEAQSDHSSVDGSDSGYLGEQTSPLFDVTIKYSNQHNLPTKLCIPLEKWLENFTSIDNDDEYSDMFTIFLCVALLEENRTAIMQASASNVDDDDCIGLYFTRLTRKNDAQKALDLAKNYHRQYVTFQMRIKQLLSLKNK